MSEATSGYYLREKLDGRDADYTLAEAFVPAPDRQAFRCLFGVRAELRELLFSRLDPELGMARLGWWSQEWERLADGNPRHPLTEALARDGQFDREDLQGALTGLAELLQQQACESFADLSRPSERIGRSLARLDMTLFGVDQAAADGVWHGIVCADLILELPRLLESGRAVLPMDLSAELQVSKADVMGDRAKRSRMIAALAEAGLQIHARNGAAAGHSWIYHAIQRRRLREYRVRQREPGRFTRLWAAWQGARQAQNARP